MDDCRRESRLKFKVEGYAPLPRKLQKVARTSDSSEMYYRDLGLDPSPHRSHYASNVVISNDAAIAKIGQSNF